MRTLRFISILALALAAAPYSSAQAKQQALLPTQFGSWDPVPYQQSVLWPRHPGIGPVAWAPDYPKLLVESGVVRVEENTYLKRDGRSTLAVRVYQLHDPSSAYEIYTDGLRPGMVPSFIANNSAVDKSPVDGEELWLLSGNLVLRVNSQQWASEADLKALVKSLEGHVDQTPLPPIRAYLPAYGLVSGTQRYALGPVGFQGALKSLQREEYGLLTNELGFNVGAETMLAQYQGGHGSGVLLLIEYPTPQLAEQHWKHLEVALAAANKQSTAVIERKGSLLSVALSPTSEEFAKALRESVNYETAVTWNEPSQTLTDPPWTSTLAKIFIGTGVFMMIAVALGIAFGGVRVITKRLFPGKVFDRPENIEVLQMGLTGKKIDPRDLY